MSQCQRCGAVNDPTSRFCVACGAPIVTRPAPPAPMPPGPTAPPPAHVSAPPPAYQPAHGAPPQPGAGSHAVIQPEHGPPSSSLPFAETASPPTGADFEAKRAAAQAVAAAEAARAG